MNKIVSFHVKKSQSLKEILKKLMHETKTNAAQLSKNTGLSFTTVRRMASEDDSNPTYSSLKKIADFFGIKPAQLIGDEALASDFEPEYMPDIKNWSSVPIILREESPNWLQDIDQIKANKNIKYVMSDLALTESVFAILADDESLEPKFSKGTILIFDPERKPSNKDYVLLLLKDRKIPQIRQILMDGPDLFCRTINPSFDKGELMTLDKATKPLGVLIQAKSNYI